MSKTSKKHVIKKSFYLILLIAFIVLIGIMKSINSQKEPSLIFKENVCFEVGEIIKKDDLIREAIDEELSNYQRIIRFDTPDTSSVTSTNRVVEIVVANANGFAREYQLEYSVKETKHPTTGCGD